MPVTLCPIAIPDFGSDVAPPPIPASTYAARCEAARERAGTDWLAVYADREHFANMMFLSGFEPRFEEPLLLLGPGSKRILLTGNECEPYAAVAGLPNLAVLLCQSFSLMGQDRSRKPSLPALLRDAGIAAGDSVGLVGWKYLEHDEWDEATAPSFFASAVVVDSLRLVCVTVHDGTAVLMHPHDGLRSAVDADQIAAFEWAATRSSLAIGKIVRGSQPGESEHAAAARMGCEGDPVNAHFMLSATAPGEAVIGLRSPSSRVLRRGDGVTTAVSFWGGLSSRAGLLDDQGDAFLIVAKAYFAGLARWYETADIGVAGGAIFDAVAATLGSGGLRSALNPGHLTGHDEWTHTPIRPGSTDTIVSGMPFQVDVIPTPMPAGAALNCEDAVTFADATLREELRARHPATFARMAARRTFMRDTLDIAVADSVLPLSSIPMCLPPFWLAPGRLLSFV